MRALRVAASLAVLALTPLLASCGTGGLAGEGGNVSEGRELFSASQDGQPSCSSCHSLEAAGAKGNIGPDLDASFGPARAEEFEESTIREIVYTQIKYPASDKASPEQAAMPANLVTGDDARAVAAFVARCAGNSDDPACASTGLAGEQPGGGTSGTDGKAIFASSGCGSCHALADAGSSGNIGPNLDESQPTVQLAVQRVTNGAGAMPAFKDQLSEKQIQAVAQYVADSAGK